MKLAPTFDRVVVIPDARKDKTAGGLIIPDTNKERPLSGVISAVGPGKHDNGVFVPTTLKVGSHVFFTKLAGQEIDTPTGKFIVIHECDIMAVEIE